MCTTNNSQLPIVYACSGCSNLAQLANDLALWLHQDGNAQMASIAGVAGHVDTHLAILHSGRPVIALDGCYRGCVSQCLSQEHVDPRWHVQLDSCGIAAQAEGSCSLQETFAAMQYVCEHIGLVADEHFIDHVKGPKSLP